jgi:hypothetical protein
MGRYDEVLEHIPAVIAAQERVVGPENANTFYSRIVLAEAMVKNDDPEAGPYARELAADISAVYGPDHWLIESLQPVLDEVKAPRTQQNPLGDIHHNPAESVP